MPTAKSGLDITVSDVFKNPVNDILAQLYDVSTMRLNEVEAVYSFFTHKNVLMMLKSTKPFNQDLWKLNHNKLLDLYPGYQYIFGPFATSTAVEFNLVYLLYTSFDAKTRSEPAVNSIKVIYASRALHEERCGRVTPSKALPDLAWYINEMEQLKPIEKLSNNCYYNVVGLTSDQRKTIIQTLRLKSLGHPSYVKEKEFFTISAVEESGHIKNFNYFKVLYMIDNPDYVPRPGDYYYPANGRKGDMSLGNARVRFNSEAPKLTEQELLERYGLDVKALLEIYKPTGYNRFKGLYNYGECKEPGNANRNYVKLVKDGLNKEISFHLAKALMTVQLGRLLSSDELVDHINNDKTDDRVENLRIVTRADSSSEDSVRRETDPVKCHICGKDHNLNKEQFGIYTNYNMAIACSPECKAELKKLPLARRRELSSQNNIMFRYYFADKTTGERLYFPTQDYRECRKELSRNGTVNLLKTPPQFPPFNFKPK